jgi:hypothetical protein
MKNIYFKGCKIFFHSRYKRQIKKIERVLVIGGLIIALVSNLTEWSRWINTLSFFIAFASFIIFEFFVVFERRQQTFAVKAHIKRYNLNNQNLT